MHKYNKNKKNYNLTRKLYSEVQSEPDTDDLIY